METWVSTRNIRSITTVPKDYGADVMGVIDEEVGPPIYLARNKCNIPPNCPEWTWLRGYQNQILKVSGYTSSKNKNTRVDGTHISM